MPRDECAHALCSLCRETPPETKARDELPVVHRAPAEGALGHPGIATEAGDLEQQRAVAGALALFRGTG
jgi:hypothetical protein